MRDTEACAQRDMTRACALELYCAYFAPTLHVTTESVVARTGARASTPAQHHAEVSADAGGANEEQSSINVTNLGRSSYLRR
jgi:hypothetical protein